MKEVMAQGMKNMMNDMIKNGEQGTEEGGLMMIRHDMGTMEQAQAQCPTELAMIEEFVQKKRAVRFNLKFTTECNI